MKNNHIDISFGSDLHTYRGVPHELVVALADWYDLKYGDIITLGLRALARQQHRKGKIPDRLLTLCFGGTN